MVVRGRCSRALGLWLLLAGGCAAAPSQPSSGPPAAAVAPAPPTAIHQVLESAGAISFHPLAGKMLVQIEDRLLEVQGDELALRPELGRGLEPRGGRRWYIQHVEGFWPDAVALVAVESDPATEEPVDAHYFVWSPLHERWIERGRALPGRWVTHLARWTEGRVLAVEQTHDPASANRVTLRVVAGRQRAGRVADELRGLDPFMNVSGISALPSGEIVLAGDLFVGQNNISFSSWIASFRPGDEHGSVVAAPLSNKLLFLTGAFLSRGEGELYLTGAGRYRTPYLARRDREGWSRIAVDLPEPLDGIWDEPGGRMWVRASCQLHVATGRGTDGWRRVLPEAVGGDALLPTDQVWPRADGDVWIVAEREQARNQVLLRTGTPKGKVDVPRIEPLPRKFKTAPCRDRW